jgi:hypothetical protein
MRRVFCACFFVIAAATTSADTQTPPQMVVVGIRQVDGTQPMDAWVGLQRSELYLDAPTADVPARAAVSGATIETRSFRIRAWKEGVAARVVVYAVMPDTRAPMRETETAIATYLLAVGGSAVILETKDWGAKAVVISVASRPVSRSAESAWLAR